MSLSTLLRRLVVMGLALGLLFSIACGAGAEPTPTPTKAPAAPTPTTAPATPTATLAPGVPTPTPTRAIATPTAATAPTPTPTPSGEKPRYGGTLTFGQTVDSLDIGDRASHQWGDIGMIINLYGQILRYNILDRTTVEGDMAESWSVSADGLTWKFKIRSGIVDHDGEAYGTEQIAYQMYRYVARPNSFPARRQTCWQNAVAKTTWPPKAGDGVTFDKATNTVTVVLQGQRAWFLGCVAQVWSQFGPMKKYLPIDQSGKYRELDPTTAGTPKNEIIGTGPFKLVDYSRQNKESFVRFDKYWRPGLPYLDGTTTYAIDQVPTLVASLRAGRIDGICCFTTPQLSDAVALKKVFGDQLVVPLSESLGWSGIVLNVARPPLGPTDDPKAKTIRKAMDLFVDREKMNVLVYQGTGWPSFYYYRGWDWIYSQEEWEKKPGYNPKTKAQDQAEAKRLMQSLGYGPNNMVTVELFCSDTGAPRRTCEVLTEDLKQIYINVNARLQQDITTEQREGKFDMTEVARGYTFEDPESYDGSLFLPYETGNSNWGRWNNAKYNQLYAEQLPIGDQAKRGAVLRQMADILYDDHGFITLTRPGTLPMYRGNWRGWAPPRIHVMNISLEQVWLSTDPKAPPDVLKKYDIFTKFPDLYPLK